MKQEDIRENVSKVYTRAISQASPTCCGPTTAESTNGCNAMTNLAGYNQREITTNPHAATASFGCGNPFAFSAIKKGDVVVDLGSGAGFDLLLAAEKVGPTGRVIGVDMTDAMLEAAQRNIKAASADNIELRKGIIEELPVDDSSVDWLISNCVINLSPEKERVFSEIFRVLKPGGQMMISDIVVQELPEEIRQIKALYSSCIAGAISEEDYISGLLNAGLVEVTVVNRLVYDPSQLKGFLNGGDTPELAKIFAEMNDAERTKTIDRILKLVNGKIWSGYFSARKP